MLKLIRLAAGAILNAREWLLLLAMASVAAWFYVDGQRVRSDRDKLVHVADVICASAGVRFAAGSVQVQTASGKTRTVHFKRGDRCATRVAGLAAFMSDTERQTAQQLVQAMRDHDGKIQADTLGARIAAEQARDSARRMEIENGKVDKSTNRVDGDWFSALNNVAGLR